jgi:hypothetical protein
MTQRSLCRTLIALTLGAIFASQAGAADFTFFIGGAKPGKLNSSELKTALDGSPVYGFRLSTNFVPLFGMEHTLAFSSDYLFPRNLPNVTEAKGVVFNSNLIVNLPVRKVVPYVTAGVGLIHQYGSGNLPVGTKFAFNYGGGLKFPRLAGPLGFRFDARGYTAVGIFSTRLNILEVSGGVLLSF